MSDQTELTTTTWGFLLRVMFKAVLLFGLCNLIFALTYPLPLDILGRISAYNVVSIGRDRLPHAPNPQTWYSVTMNNVTAMMASHGVSNRKAEDEFRVFLLGDSATWGWLLENDETLAAALNALALQPDDQRIVFYNLAYPEPSVTKDVLLLDSALHHQPDAIIWLLSPTSLLPSAQTGTPLLDSNTGRISELLGASSNISVEPISFADRTIIGQREALANWTRLQTYSISWTATEIDQAIPDDFNRVSVDLDNDESWDVYAEPTTFSVDDLVFDILDFGIAHADVPVLLVNEPMFISDGANSDVRYNANYPIWAYDQYRVLFADVAAEMDWNYVDLWDALPPAEFTNTPLHYSPDGAQLLADLLADPLMNMLISE